MAWNVVTPCARLSRWDPALTIGKSDIVDLADPREISYS